MIPKVAVQIGIPTLLLLIACDAFLAVNHLRSSHKMTALIHESSAIQKNISAVLQDLIDMETSQRGYLLTGDPAYLQPYRGGAGQDRSRFRRTSYWVGQSGTAGTIVRVAVRVSGCVKTVRDGAFN